MTDLNSPLPQGKGTATSTSKIAPPGDVAGASSGRQSCGQTCFTGFPRKQWWWMCLQDGPQPRSCAVVSQVRDTYQFQYYFT